jgi:hypothetical protein
MQMDNADRYYALIASDSKIPLMRQRGSLAVNQLCSLASLSSSLTFTMTSFRLEKSGREKI